MLRVWLPLTKDLRNQGLDDVTVTNNGATFNSAGKLGGCYSFDGTDDRISCSSYTWSYPLSICAWFKPTDVTNSNTQYWLSYNTASGGTAGHAIGIGTYGGKLSVWFGGMVRSLSTTLSNNVWYHITFTININKKATIYLNGEQIDTFTFTANNPGSTWFTIGARSNSNSGGVGGALYYYKGYMNDVRLYDHCLSPMEVKQISQGLVLHYPLNRNGWGQENLIKDTDFSGVSKKYTVTSGTEGGFTFTPTETIVANTEYIVSCRLRGNANMNLYKLCTGGNESLSWVNRSQLSTTEYRSFSIVFTYPSNKTLNQIYICTRYGTTNTSTGDWFEIEPYSLKLEKGSIATPWCPNSSDALATTMGLNSTTEYDCSGFCNNGTRTGTFTWTSNAPKYAVSQVFNGTDNAIQTPSLPVMITDKNYTIAVWIYKTAIGSKGYQTIYGGPSGFEIEARNGSANETKFVPWNWGKPMASYELNEWNHCVFVHSDSDCKIYLNGEYIATGTAKASNPTGNYFIGAWNTATQQNFDGLMSDFRIYATALSTSDVQSLYQNSAYIDSSGNVYGAVHSEV